MATASKYPQDVTVLCNTVHYYPVHLNDVKLPILIISISNVFDIHTPQNKTKITKQNYAINTFSKNRKMGKSHHKHNLRLKILLPFPVEITVH